jgi:hypothetical protein
LGKIITGKPHRNFPFKISKPGFPVKMFPSSNSDGLDWCLLPSGNQTWQWKIHYLEVTDSATARLQYSPIGSKKMKPEKRSVKLWRA